LLIVAAVVISSLGGRVRGGREGVIDAVWKRRMEQKRARQGRARDIYL
jgi:hypothetical protein